MNYKLVSILYLLFGNSSESGKIRETIFQDLRCRTVPTEAKTPLPNRWTSTRARALGST